MNEIYKLALRANRALLLLERKEAVRYFDYVSSRADSGKTCELEYSRAIRVVREKAERLSRIALRNCDDPQVLIHADDLIESSIITTILEDDPLYQVTTRRWIPVESELPPDKVFVLVRCVSGYMTTNHNVVLARRYEEYRPGRWVTVGNDNVSDFTGGQPTHWSYVDYDGIC